MGFQDKRKLQKLCYCALFTAIALTIFIIESRLPAPLPIPGAKLGLANAVTLYVAYSLGCSYAFQVLFCRILLSAMFAGQLLSLFYSATGGLCCFLCLCLLKPLFSWEKLWFLSPCCAMAHMVGQVTIASFLLGTEEIFYFLPYLVLLSLVSGLFVGIATQHLCKRTLHLYC